MRPELEFHHRGAREEGGKEESGGEVVVKDPVQGRYFTLSSLAATVAKLMDGERTAAQVADAVNRQSGARAGEELTAEEVKELADQLERMGFFSFVTNGQKRAHVLPSSVLAFPVHLVDPERFLAGLARRLSFLFTLPALIVGLVLIASGILVCAFNLKEWSFTLVRELGVHSLLTIYLPALVMMALHELGHGVTCARYGCQVKDMGVIFYYFQPCTYCNVSDSWTLGRSERIRVMLAGIFFEAELWALMVLAYAFSSPHGVFGQIALGIVATSGVKCLFNLNPLIKLDGYYVLSDLLDLPNLRERSFRYLVGFLFRRKPEELGRGHRLACLLYAPLALVYSAVLIGLFAFWLYRFLSLRLGEWGGWVFLAICLIAAVGILLRLAAGKKPVATS